MIELSGSDAIDLIENIAEALEEAEDARDFCLWLAELLEVDVSAS